MTDSPLVSIIITNWNGIRYLEKCLGSVRSQTYKNIETIVVDNNSTDGSLDFIAREFPEVLVIKSGRNYGFAKANNTGIEASNGKYIATMNNDTEAERDWIKNLVIAMEKSPDVGMCASKILLFNHRDLIDSAGMQIYPDGIAFCRGHLKKDQDSYKEEDYVLLPTACAALYSKEAVVRAGLFDGDYFAYGEDIDLGIRIGMLGYKCVYVPTARIYHYYSGTIGSNLSLKVYLSERNRIFTLMKCCSRTDLVLSFYHTVKRYLYYIYAWFKKAGVSRDFAKKESVFEIISVFFKVYFSVALGAAGMLKKRREIKLGKKMRFKKLYALKPEFKIKAREIAMERRIYIDWQ